ncbi:MAG: phosphoribosylamine--glycine ligase [Candidatus Eisenbacteria bacterium]|uniref:Phosphoribosylamine--glycine ligase n=1 Tax=Eiseniibacteriota bacterium TaxID=2212470 RepID=A0A937XAH1_UNCEI|nr:phosphoribosylamine--glycine ligase [Candidatus Eisenbacteria bacterium]
MRVLIVGGGGREHALGWAIRRSPLGAELHAMPGNPGLAGIAVCHPGDPLRAVDVGDLVSRLGIDLVVVGPEAPLVAGLGDAIAARGVRVFGPSAAASRIEGSKIFAKELMRRHGIPTAAHRVFDDPESAFAAAREARYPLVIKADGLAAGKGALIAGDAPEARLAIEALMVERRFGEAGARIVFEEFLEGEEMSVFAIAAGERYRLLPATQDHKRAYDGDQGPNTGGMGAYAPVPGWRPQLEACVRREVIEPTLAALAAEGCPYTGLLYAGLMVKEGAPRVVEFNCRFGDPETQALVAVLSGDLLAALWAAADPAAAAGELPPLGHDGRAGVCVVVAAGGYPGPARQGDEIAGVDEAAACPGALVFHAGTELRDGRLRTRGGRVLNVVGVGDDLQEARDRAYAAAGRIHISESFYRRDIAWRGLRARERSALKSGH